MTKFKPLASFSEPEELAQWQKDKKLSWCHFKSDLRKCTTCPDSRHKMRCVIAKCTNEDCNQGNASCPKRYKINTCQHTGMVQLYEDGEHLGEIFEINTHGISEKVKLLIEDLIEKHDNHPKKIHISLMTRKKWRSIYFLY